MTTWPAGERTSLVLPRPLMGLCIWTYAHKTKCRCAHRNITRAVSVHTWIHASKSGGKSLKTRWRNINTSHLQGRYEELRMYQVPTLSYGAPSWLGYKLVTSSGAGRQTDNTHANNSWTWVAKDTRTCAFTIYFLSVSISPSVSQSLKVNSRVSVSKNCMKRGQVRVICMKCTVSTPKGITFNWSICCVNIKPCWSVCCMWCQFSWLIYKLARSGINPSRDHLTKNVVDTGGFGGRGRYLKKKKYKYKSVVLSLFGWPAIALLFSR